MKTKTLNVVMIATTTKTNLVLSAFNTLFLSPPMEVKNTDKYQCLCFTSNDKFEENDWVTDGKTISQVIYLNVDDSDMDEYRKIEATTNPELKLYVAETLASASGYSKKTNDILIPQIPQSFIESYIKAYNEGTPILTVDVEMFALNAHGSESFSPEIFGKYGYKIKTNSSNEVIVVEPKIPIYEIFQNNNKVGIFFTQQLANRVNSFLKEPKFYTKEEVILLVTNAFKAGYERSDSGYPNTDNHTKPNIEKFIQQNL